MSTSEMLASVLKFENCFGTFLNSTTNKEIKILLLSNYQLRQNKSNKKQTDKSITYFLSN